MMGDWPLESPHADANPTPAAVVESPPRADRPDRWAGWERRFQALVQPPASAGSVLDRAEKTLLVRILLAALLLRVVALGTFPGNITADEADNTQFALHVKAGMP